MGLASVLGVRRTASFSVLILYECGEANPLWYVGLLDTSHHRVVIDTHGAAHPAGICGAR